MIEHVGGALNSVQRVMIAKAALLPLYIELQDRKALQVGGEIFDLSQRQYLARVASLRRTLALDLRSQGHPLADGVSRFVWLDGRPLLDAMEPYRREIFTRALFSFDDDGTPAFNFTLTGRGKKNWKSCDLVLVAFYRFLIWPSPQGNDPYVLANDEAQAGHDLSLGRKLTAVNKPLSASVTVGAKSITWKDGRGVLCIVPARDANGQHGKTALFIGYDEIHGYMNHDLFEALAPDPTRRDVMVWIASYAGIRHAPGIPRYDYMQTETRGDNPRVLQRTGRQRRKQRHNAHSRPRQARASRCGPG